MMEARTAAVRDVIRSRIPDTSNGSPDLRDEIAEVAAVIVERFRPDRIVLFGSRASCRAHEDSDADLMIIMESAGSPIKQAVAIARAVPHRIALDVLVRTPEQIAIGLAEDDFFITDVMTEGITLFEAGDAGMD